jgi:membrane protease subunit (stomatin/prohibitin family)
MFVIVWHMSQNVYYVNCRHQKRKYSTPKVISTKIQVFKQSKVLKSCFYFFMLIIYNAQYIRLIFINSVTQNKTENQKLISQEIRI